MWHIQHGVKPEDMQTLCDWLYDNDIMAYACAVSEHKRHVWTDIEEQVPAYALCWNECENGPKGGPAGGVGWLIRRKDAHLFSRTPPNDAPAEGAAAAWVRLGIHRPGFRCFSFN